MRTVELVHADTRDKCCEWSRVIRLARQVCVNRMLFRFASQV